MKPIRDFGKQLANLEHEATVIANYVYAETAMHHAVAKSQRLRSVLNRCPTLWRTFYAALQSAAYVALGRVFDLKSPYNLEALIASMEHDPAAFSLKALESRKIAVGYSNPEKLKNYLSDAYVLEKGDIQRIRRAVARRRTVYDRAIMPVRHQYLAHRQTRGPDAQLLYAKGKVKEMWQLSSFLQTLAEQLWMLYHNGRKPNLRGTSRYSPKVMYAKPHGNTRPQEQIVSDVRTLMNILESAA
jgi:hypothetical protein